MRVRFFEPSAALSQLVHRYVLISADADVASHTIPDTAVVLSFRFRGEVWSAATNNDALMPAATIAGLRKTPRDFRYRTGAGNLLVALREGGLAAFTRLPAHDLFEATISTENLFAPSILERLLDRLANASGDMARIRIMEMFLLQTVRQESADPLITHAAGLIRHAQGQLKIKNLVASLHISQDPFEKRFRAAIGATPKQYSSIVRLRSLVDQLPASPSLTAAAYDAGYFDQSHFIRDFKSFTGHSPKAFLQSGNAW
ncbi:helix-turn-helix domain-containing protein [Chitinophaga lutea]